MTRSFLVPALLLLASCSSDFEPKLTGWTAYTYPRKRVHLDIDGSKRVLELPGDDNYTYRFPQWTKSGDQILITQSRKTEDCADFQIVAIDTTGRIIDTVYTPPPNTPVNFKLAPNDSIMLIKTYSDNCVDEIMAYNYTFYNRFTKKTLPDTVTVAEAQGLLMNETVWSPDSRKVIILEWTGFTRTNVDAYTYDLFTKDTVRIGRGTNFVWSPTDKNQVGYIKDFSIYLRNMETGEEEKLFEGRKKKSAYYFRWNQTGEFLLIHVQGYLLNFEARPFATHNTIYFSMKERKLSRTYLEAQRIDTWR